MQGHIKILKVCMFGWPAGVCNIFADSGGTFAHIFPLTHPAHCLVLLRQTLLELDVELQVLFLLPQDTHVLAYLREGTARLHS